MEADFEGSDLLLNLVFAVFTLVRCRRQKTACLYRSSGVWKTKPLYSQSLI